MINYRLASMNVRGLGSAVVRRETFHWAHKNEAKIFLFQETHSSPQVESMWKAEWGGNIVFSHGTSNSRGVCILFKNDINFEIHRKISDPEGRYIVLDITIEHTRLTLANIYGPNNDNPDFFFSLREEIESLPNDNRILIGDFNLVLDVKKDKKGGTPSTHINSQKVIQDWIDNTDLLDVWRMTHPEVSKFTWKRTRPFKIFCRLDFFLISSGLFGKVEKSNILPGFKTDHSLITLDIDLSLFERGPGF